MSSPSDGTTRRRALIGGLGLAAAGVVGINAWEVLRQPQRRVGVYRAAYDAALVDVLIRGIREWPAFASRVRGARVVLKPNLVEFSALHPINTDPRLLVALVEALRKLDAKGVTVAEGPGHRRDTEMVVEECGLGVLLRDHKIPFVDLNYDVAVNTALVAGTTGLATLPIGRTVLDTDLLISVAKMKTHHWAGATLTMKNLFGTVPGVEVGWPKNVLHYAGIEPSIVDLWTTLRPAFGIVDGIVGMEGDGPLMGSSVDFGAVVMGDDLSAVDATTARLMCLDPHKIAYIQATIKYGGSVSQRRIEQLGDAVAPRAFSVLPVFDHLRIR